MRTAAQERTTKAGARKASRLARRLEQISTYEERAHRVESPGLNARELTHRNERSQALRSVEGALNENNVASYRQVFTPLLFHPLEADEMETKQFAAKRAA